jgi:superfamily II DNA or RNA helicase
MLERFTELWHDERCIDLTADWLKDYHPSRGDTTLAPVIELDEAPVQPVEPRPVQREALTALERTRLAGHRAGLVVMATGLGKTWLAAFDTARPQFKRVLFIAHREEILKQSRAVFRQVQPDGDLGLFIGGEKRPDARFVFASVQTLAGRLEAFEADAFDYIVIDEFHHAAAPSYRRVIDHFQPKFLLGLTATPDRLDGADLLALCSIQVLGSARFG